MRIPIQDAGGDKLVEDANDERRQDRENHVIQRQRPRLVGNLSGEVVEERKLDRGGISTCAPLLSQTKHSPRTESCKAQYSCRKNLGNGDQGVCGLWDNITLTENQLRKSLVAPSAVDKEQLFQESEL